MRRSPDKPNPAGIVTLLRRRNLTLESGIRRIDEQASCDYSIGMLLVPSIALSQDRTFSGEIMDNQCAKALTTE